MINNVMKINKKTIILVAVLLSLFTCIPNQMEVAAVSSNNLTFGSITSKDGLSQDIIDCIVQDSYGYMWFGTLAGLNKYDGMNFTIYNTFLTPSLYNAYINIIYITRDDCLWVGTQFGLYRYNPEADTFTAYLNESGNSNTISNNNIRVICEDNDGILWIGTDNGLNVFNREDETFTVYLNSPDDSESISSNAVKTIYENYDGNMWIGTEGGLNIFNRDDETFTVYTNDLNDPDSISNDTIRTMFKDSSGIIWIGTANGLNRYNPETDSFIVYMNDPDNQNSISGNFITSICEDDYGNLWVGTLTGLNQLNIETTTFINYRYNENDSHGISNDNITALYKDDTGIIWIGTINGINTLNMNEQAFKYYPDITSPVSGILKADGNNLWLWRGDDLVLFDNESKGVEEIYPGVFKDTNYTNPTLCDICLGKDGYIWFGTIRYGLKKFDPVTNTTTTYVNDPGNDSSLKDDSIITLYIDHSGIIWIGTGLGLCSYNSNTQEFTQYQANPAYPDAISSGRIYSIYETSDNNIWFGTESDVYVLDNETGRVTLAISSSELSGSTSDNRVETIYQDRSGLLWIGSGCKLYSYDIGNKELVPYDLGDLTLNDFIVDIVEDNDGDIWFSNRQGLWRLSSDGSVSKYGLNDGLVSDVFCENACYIMGDGELLFGTLGGLISFYPEDLKINATAPKVLINDFSLIDEQISFDKPIEDIDEVTLSYSDNSFVIDFVALDYNSPEDNQYAYKLEGFDEGWNYCSAVESFTKYTNIPSGQYTFMVKAANSDGVWNEEGASLKIVIGTPFWQEWWFIIFIITLAVLVVFVIIKLRTRVISRHAQELEIQVERRTSDLKDQIDERINYTRALVHELKTPLSPLLASSDYLVQQIKDESLLKFARNINRGALHLSTRIDELVDLAKIELGLIKITCNPVNLNKLLTDIMDYSRPEASMNGQTLVLDIPDNMSRVLADEVRIKQVIFNLLNNAFKYTNRGGTITIKAEEKDGGVVIEVIDTGRGIDEEKQKYLFQPLYKKMDDEKDNLSGLGIGLQLSKMFIDLHGGHIWVRSEVGKGSEFGFWLPYGSDCINNSG